MIHTTKKKQKKTFNLELYWFYFKFFKYSLNIYIFYWSLNDNFGLINENLSSLEVVEQRLEKVVGSTPWNDIIWVERV